VGEIGRHRERAPLADDVDRLGAGQEIDRLLHLLRADRGAQTLERLRAGLSREVEGCRSRRPARAQVDLNRHLRHSSSRADYRAAPSRRRERMRPVRHGT